MKADKSRRSEKRADGKVKANESRRHQVMADKAR